MLLITIVHLQLNSFNNITVFEVSPEIFELAIYLADDNLFAFGEEVGRALVICNAYGATIYGDRELGHVPSLPNENASGRVFDEGMNGIAH